ncbi:MAG: beta-glucuronidase [Verrucomicrobiota bacterium JB022]|nr:beta-glucuronidase [Verrucomicrobiota bacterium JB022]
MLYPIDSETREVKELNGLWDFQLDADNRGLSERWFEQTTLPGNTLRMPVPASYNDITTEARVRDHIGPVWYRRTFFVPRSWQGQRVAIRIGSASHRAIVWCNGVEIVRHKGGYLPFEGPAAEAIHYGAENTIVVRVDNILDWTTLPPGEIVTETGKPPYPPGYQHQVSYHDFFNYSGIHRPVRLVVTPPHGIEDITVVTTLDERRCGVVKVTVGSGAPQHRLTLHAADGAAVATDTGTTVELQVSRPELWEPGHPYLYELKVEALDENGEPFDVYRLPVGIRTIRIDGDRFLLNEKPFYFRGFGKHEDSDVRGKGLDEALNQRDFNLLKWINANSFRTTHYPYSEEIMRMADREGIVIIDEVPAVGLYFFNDEDLPTKDVFTEKRAGKELREHHKDCIREMIARDKNHPCVVMWSLGNETATHEDEGAQHYREVAALVRELDSTRPLTIVEYNFAWFSKVGDTVDVLGVNRYYGWYFDTARLDTIELKLMNELQEWHRKWKKPVLFTEYGADTISGYHVLPSRMFSEEFQIDYLDACNRVIDQCPFVIGEHVWNFADFQTKQGLVRFGGNKKGVFTRQREPKAAAHYIRKRWQSQIEQDS